MDKREAIKGLNLLLEWIQPERQYYLGDNFISIVENAIKILETKNNCEGKTIGTKIKRLVVPPNHYKCARCDGVFEYEWTDEEAIKEKEQNFPSISLKECIIVCDDCYKELMEDK